MTHIRNQIVEKIDETKVQVVGEIKEKLARIERDMAKIKAKLDLC